jgi:hypothetical protein
MVMDKQLRLSAVIILVSLVLVTVAVAQPRPQAEIMAQPFGGGWRTILLELTMLMRLAALELTVDQLDAILEIVTEQPAETDSQTMQNIRAFRERLLRGEQATVADWQLLKDARKDAFAPVGKSREDQQRVQLIRALLNPQQLSALAQGTMGIRQQENAGVRTAVVVLSALNRIMKQDDPDKRQEGSDKLLKAIGEAVPEKLDEGMVEDLQAFFSRVTEMNQVEFAAAQKELLAELGVLLPPELDVGKLYMAMEPERVNQAIVALFMTEQAKSLLAEMRDARADAR